MRRLEFNDSPQVDPRLLIIEAISLQTINRVSKYLQDRGRPAGFRDWLASTVCSFLCCLGCCRPDTPPQRDESREKRNNRKLSGSAVSTAQQSKTTNRRNKGKVITRDENLKALAAAVHGAKEDDIETNA